MYFFLLGFSVHFGIGFFFPDLLLLLGLVFLFNIGNL